MWFGPTAGRRANATLETCCGVGKASLCVESGITLASHVASWLRARGVRVLNVAGDLESKSPGIGVQFGHRPGD